MTNILLYILIFLSVTNFIILIVLGSFLVQFRQRVNGLFADFATILEDLFGTIPVPTVEPIIDRSKTWDEKYEEELELRDKQIKERSGLQDLAEQSELSWGSPPALNPQNAKGLTIIDKQSIM